MDSAFAVFGPSTVKFSSRSCCAFACFTSRLLDYFGSLGVEFVVTYFPHLRLVGVKVTSTTIYTWN